ncbi:MAG: hypothetical protein ACPG5B_04110 [Chitinophagales bacterium]
MKQDKLALKTMKKALQFKEKDSWHKDDYLLLALKYAQVRDFSKTKENLVESMSLGINLSQLQTNYILNEFSNTHFWEELLVDAPLLAEKFKEKRNVEVISQHSKISTILFQFSFNYEPPLNPKTFKPHFIGNYSALDFKTQKTHFVSNFSFHMKQKETVKVGCRI